MNAVLYALRAGEEGGPVKFGYSKRRWDERPGELQVGNPEVLYRIAVCQGERKDETRVKHLFRDVRLRGEWFRSTPELLTYIAAWGLSVGHDGTPWTGVVASPFYPWTPQPPHPSISAEAFADRYLEATGTVAGRRKSLAARHPGGIFGGSELERVRRLALWLGAPRDWTKSPGHEM